MAGSASVSPASCESAFEEFALARLAPFDYDCINGENISC
jgi:hypothetical protein